MHRGHRLLSSLFLASALIAPALTIGCAEHHYYRAYDPDHNDYHSWNDNEVVYYRQWETEKRYDHRDFKRRDRDEQKEYWNWRHQHDRDHDKDKDKDKDNDKH
jgi:hypothetical protein